MMMNSIFDKTDKGREEIATRKYHLASKLRSLLLLIDGKHSGDDLLKKFAGLGMNDQVLQELLANDYIHNVTSASVATPATTPEQSIDTPIHDDSIEGILPEGENQFQSLYHFYSETIKSTIGLRGYPLQLKVERANSIADFRALRTPYLEAVFKAKGAVMARSLRDRLDQLLYLGETPPAHTNPPNVNF
jgi:hypothetical protein